MPHINAYPVIDFIGKKPYKMITSGYIMITSVKEPYHSVIRFFWLHGLPMPLLLRCKI